MFDIQNKVALVTGGCSGIGLATAKKLLANGAKGVVLADINQDAGKRVIGELSKQYGKKRVIFVPTDVSNKKSFEGAFKRAVHEFGNIDILVNNAGICDEPNYEKTIAVNLKGVINGIMLAMDNYIAKYKSSSEGVIVNTASVAACEIYPSVPIYASTKAGVANLTMGLGHKEHYERTKIRIVAVAPGATDTDILNHLKFLNKDFADLNELTIKKIQKIGVFQQPDIVAECIIKLIKEKPSGTVWISANNQEPSQFYLKSFL